MNFFFNFSRKLNCVYNPEQDNLYTKQQHWYRTGRIALKCKLYLDFFSIWRVRLKKNEYLLELWHVYTTLFGNLDVFSLSKRVLMLKHKLMKTNFISGQDRNEQADRPLMIKPKLFYLLTCYTYIDYVKVQIKKKTKTVLYLKVKILVQ